MIPHTLCCFILLGAFHSSLLAQGGQATPTIETLKIRVLEGADAVHNVATGIAAPLVVEVRDPNEAPVEDTVVTFEVPTNGPSGTFGDGKLTYSVKTNFQGQAAWQGFRPNKETGSFQVKITASIGRQSGRTTVRQGNSLRDFVADQPKRKRKWVPGKKTSLILAGAAGAGVGTWLALRSGAPTSITLVPGSVVFGPPR